MLRRVALIRIEVSEELSASIIMVDLGRTLAVTKTDGTSDPKRTTRRNIPVEDILHSHCRENLKSYIHITSSSNFLLFLMLGF
jgi:hypothetical protein